MRLWIWVGLLALLGCSETTEVFPGADAGPADVGLADGGEEVPIDAGMPGCGNDDHCGSGQRCDVAGATCVCLPGTHRCGDACLPDDSAASCGDRCTPCPAVPGAAATCDGVRCGFECDPDRRFCGGACALCPSEGVASLTCSGQRCVADTCEDGHLACDSGCARCPEEATEVGCAGSRCVALSCGEGARVCDAGCCLWSFETILMRQAHAGHLHAALDGDGAFHVAATDQSGVRYLHATAAGWEELPALAQHPHSVTVGPAGTTPQVLLTEGSFVTFARYTAEGWAEEGLGAAGFFNRNAHMAASPRGETHVCFWHDLQVTPRTYVLNHFTRTQTGQWQRRTADIADAWGERCWVAVDELGTPHMTSSHFDGSLRYLLLTSQGWGGMTIDPSAGPQLMRLALDGRGQPHLCYRSSFSIHYARWNGGAWETELIAPAEDCSLGADAQGRVHLVVEDGRGLHYRFRAAPRMPWSGGLLSATGARPSLLVDRTGAPHVFFRQGQRIIHAH